MSDLALFKQWVHSPGYKVVEEWGTWRDEQQQQMVLVYFESSRVTGR